ncbi:hypothetical protein JMJ56_26215 [Belnapia sp. T18]|uniref:Uncharacterized protein n=1 Tax=Belnapia arida TaxID=2804533 RepID=A0ABS1UE00_9PROT|nr:hypothetical protein [Belnapia arida]MBL6081491.1 hypothetical protein [Belnapia arida]
MSSSLNLLSADINQIDRFIVGLFPYADRETFVSLRSFFDETQGVHHIEAVPVGNGMTHLVEAASAQATKCARHPSPTVFCPPVATFNNPNHARDADLANGLALSVECDARPKMALETLEKLLGPATIVVRSGGLWTDQMTGEVQDKLHLHWRLAEPTRNATAHAELKRARRLAVRLVGADSSNVPAVHPIRWPGSWHRKAAPRMAEIVASSDAEIMLSDALERLENAVREVQPNGTATDERVQNNTNGGVDETSELIRRIVAGEAYHEPLVALAMRYHKGGMQARQIVLTLRGAMRAVPERIRDRKGESEQPGRWQARIDDIPRLVASAVAKAPHSSDRPEEFEESWPEPVDFLSDSELTGEPQLKSQHLPDALACFVFDTAERMGVDPVAVALSSLVALSSVAHDDWVLAPKAFDRTWTESARL